MKTARLGLAALLFAGITFAEEFDLVDYSPKNGTVWIKTAVGREKRPFDSFSAEDQKKITGWLADREFQSGLTVTVEKREKRRETSRGEIIDTWYVLILENSSEARLENIEAAYQMFYENKDGSSEQKLRKTGNYQVSLLPGETKTLETTVIPLRNEKVVSGTVAGITTTVNVPATTISLPFGGGDRSFGGGSYTTVSPSSPATMNLTDRMLGAYLCVSRRDSFGKKIIRESEIGQAPEKDKWNEFRTQSAPSAAQSQITRNTTRSATNTLRSTTNGTSQTVWNESKTEALIAKADGGDYNSAFSLCLNYSKAGDREKTKEWAARARELINAKAPLDDQATKRMLSALDILERSAPIKR